MSNCKHDWRYMEPHKYRDAKYNCALCDADLTVEQYETISGLMTEIKRLEEDNAKFREWYNSCDDDFNLRYDEVRLEARATTAKDIIHLIDVKTAITGGGYHYHISAPILKAAIKEKFGLEI